MSSSFITLSAVVLLGILQIIGAVPMFKRDTKITAKDVQNICRLKNWPTGQYPNPFDCRKFIKCANGVTDVESCPSNLVYDKSKKVCNWPFLTTCDTDPITQAPKVLHEIKLCHEKHWPNGIYEDPFNCKKFIQCVADITYITACPDQELYDPFHKTCNDPAKVVCKSKPTSSP